MSDNQGEGRALGPNVNRRKFAQLTGALAGGVGLACQSGTETNSPQSPDSHASSGGATPGGGASAQGGALSMGGSGGGAGGAHTCGEITATNIEGPFFLDGSPERTDIREGFPGQRLRLTGCVFDSDCRPIEDALLDFWQADESGGYDAEGHTFRGHQQTNAEGSYVLDTIVPGRYLNGAEFRPAHIHVKVSFGGETLTTQLYFPDDPYNDIDAFIDERLIIDVIEHGQELLGHFDFTLSFA